MKGKTIIGLVLAAGLLLIGTVAYGHWNDYGPQGNYGTGYGYGHVYGAGYNVRVNYPAIKTHVPCYGYRHGGRNWNTYDDRYGYGYGNDWMGHRGHGRTGPRGCW